MRIEQLHQDTTNKACTPLHCLSFDIIDTVSYTLLVIPFVANISLLIIITIIIGIFGDIIIPFSPRSSTKFYNLFFLPGAPDTRGLSTYFLCSLVESSNVPANGLSLRGISLHHCLSAPNM